MSLHSMSVSPALLTESELSFSLALPTCRRPARTGFKLAGSGAEWGMGREWERNRAGLVAIRRAVSQKDKRLPYAAKNSSHPVPPFKSLEKCKNDREVMSHTACHAPC
jgi:hypothetical protein